MEKECPRCAEVIKVRARYCRHCGYEYSDEEFTAEKKAFEEELVAEKKAIEEIASKKAESEKEKALISKGIMYLGYQIKKNRKTSLYQIYESGLRLKGSMTYESIEAAKKIRAPD